MFLDYIEITNYRPYYDKQKINFGFNKDKNLTVILADNGSGKTSLVNALTWCLYGKEHHDTRRKTEPLYNLRAATEARENGIDKVTVKVKIKFHYYDVDEFGENVKKSFIISREIEYQYQDNIWSNLLKSYVVVEETGEEIRDGEAAKIAIEDKIPKDMFQYFFFNGATLSNYFKKDSKFNLKTSIEDISQIGLINNVSDHLIKTLDVLNKRYDKEKPTGRNYNKLISNKIAERKSVKNTIESNKLKIDEAHELIIEYTNKLKNADSKHAKELSVERENLEKERNALKNNITNTRNKYESLILELFPITVLFDEMVNSIKIADSSRKKKTAPPEIESTLLNDILEDGYCICGVKLEDHPECVEELKNRLKKTSKVKTEQFFKEYYAIKNTLVKLKNLPSIEDYKNNLNDYTNHLKVVNNRLDEISDEIKSIDLESVSLYEQHRDDNKTIKKDLEDENELLFKKSESLKNEIIQLKDERDREGELEGKLGELSKKIKFCENALAIVSTFNEEVQEHIRNKVNDKTRSQFMSMDWGDYDKYTDVTILKDYSIRITKSSGEKISPADLSDGEENLLALSFMMALHSLSGFEIPLIIDAPLEKLDKTKRIDFISDLHKYTSDKQIIFLFTDSQYTEDVRLNMLDHIVDEYELKPSENKTEIVKYE